MLKRSDYSRILFLLIIFPFIFINCKNSGREESAGKNSGFTNASDQEYLLIFNEFDKNNYARVLDFAGKFFKENSLNEDNLKILLLQAHAKEKLCKDLNKKGAKDRLLLAKKYDFIVNKNTVSYDYGELKTVWEKFPDSSYGKDAFFEYVKKATNSKEKINSYTEFVDNIKDKDLKDKLQLELSDMILQGLNDLNGEKAEKLDKLYKDILKTGYKDKVVINSIILKYKITGDKDLYNKELKELVKENNFNGMMAYYLTGELYFINNDLLKAKDYFKTVKKMFKVIKNDDRIPVLVSRLEYLSSQAIDSLKLTVNKKIELIDKLKEYHDALKEKKVAYITGDRIRVRKDPAALRSNIVSTLYWGDQVTIVRKGEKIDKLENEENYWYLIQLMDNTTGWVFGKYLLFYIY